MRRGAAAHTAKDVANSAEDWSSSAEEAANSSEDGANSAEGARNTSEAWTNSSGEGGNSSEDWNNSSVDWANSARDWRFLAVRLAISRRGLAILRVKTAFLAAWRGVAPNLSPDRAVARRAACSVYPECAVTGAKSWAKDVFTDSRRSRRGSKDEETHRGAEQGRTSE